MEKIAVFGTGYVGLVTGACFVNAGHNVTCVDIDETKIERLKKGECPIVEKDLPVRIEKGVQSGNLSFTTNASLAVKNCKVIFIAVGTPTKKGSEEADLSAVFAVARTIQENADSSKIVIQKSTVPVGTGDEVEEILNSQIKSGEDRFFHVVVSNPEFLKEGRAIHDFEYPDRVVIGTNDKEAQRVMRKIYVPFMRTSDRMIFMSRPSAELTKVVANTMLAMRISAMNAITPLAEKFGADVTEVRRGIGTDSRIGTAFLFPGGATFGGSCFPKDVRALIAIMEESGMDAGIFKEVMEINHEQRMRFIGKILNYFEKGDITGKKIAVWGLSFKPGTDDVREAASFDVIRTILEKGGTVSVFDEHAKEIFRNEFGNVKGIEYCDDQYVTTKDADALVILTDAMEFRLLDLERLKKAMNKLVIFDGKNLHDPEEMSKEGAHYICMGRPFFNPKS